MALAHQNTSSVTTNTTSPKSSIIQTNELRAGSSMIKDEVVGLKNNRWITFCITAVVVIVVTAVVVSSVFISTRKKPIITITPARAGMPPDNSHWSFRVMSYNIRLDTPRDEVNQWRLRRDRVASLIRYHGVDLFGVQEALPNQMVDLQTALPAFEWSGAGRDDGKSQGEFSAVFYRSSRFELLDNDTFWLSETPEKPGSKGWDADVTRVCSWVKLRDRWTDQIVYHFNTHFDHIGEVARRESARLIVTRVQSITKLNAPVIFTGDLNAGPSSDAYHVINTNSTLRDTKELTEISHYGPNSTWSTFFVGQGLGDRIDYIFITPRYLRTLQHAILTDSDNQYYPSDHLPVLAELTVMNTTKLN